MTDTLGRTHNRSKVAVGHRDRGTGGMAQALARGTNARSVTYQRRIQRHREMLRDMVAAVEADGSGRLRHWLRAYLTEALSVLEGPRLPFSAEQLAYLAQVDGIEDGQLARLIAQPDCPVAVAAWLRAAEAENASRVDMIAAARAVLANGGQS